MPRLLSLLCLLTLSLSAPAADRPNVLWITCEDISPHLGCYGDADATTPNLDKLAAKSLRYTAVWSNAPVCAPARTTLITGMYPPSIGAEHMRSEVPLPQGVKLYPQYLREAGYYCTNNVKEDYNIPKPAGTWDDSSKQAHFKNRKPDQPFFAVFNFVTTHESQVRARPHTPVHDAAKIHLPAYHPDAPEVRRDWAQYHDKITDMDKQTGKLLAELTEAGLNDETIVFFYSDHGAGMPRSKRVPCNSGLQVPLLIHFPAKWKHLAPPDSVAGGTSNRLVSFVDFAPTLLSLCGVKPPVSMQGQAFLGQYASEPRQYVFGFRGRMDERIDCVRSVRDGRYVYLRNFLPHLPHGQHNAYMMAMPTAQAWKRLFEAGKLPPQQAYFWSAPKAPEELYDLESDRDEVNNLANDPKHLETLQRLRTALHNHQVSTRDVGILPEAEMLRQANGKSPRDIKDYSVEPTLNAAELASNLKTEAVAELRKLLTAPEPGVRYWAVLGLMIRKSATEDDLKPRLTDESPAVRIVAAEALVRTGSELGLAVLLEHADPVKYGTATAVQSLNAIDNLGERAASLKPSIAKLPPKDPKAVARASDYCIRLADHILGRPRKE